MAAEDDVHFFVSVALLILFGESVLGSGLFAADFTIPIILLTISTPIKYSYIILICGYQSELGELSRGLSFRVSHFALVKFRSKIETEMRTRLAFESSPYPPRQTRDSSEKPTSSCLLPIVLSICYPRD